MKNCDYNYDFVRAQNKHTRMRCEQRTRASETSRVESKPELNVFQKIFAGIIMIPIVGGMWFVYLVIVFAVLILAFRAAMGIVG